MIVFSCGKCQTSLSAEESQAQQLVRCPICSVTLRVPGGPPATPGPDPSLTRPAPAPAPGSAPPSPAPPAPPPPPISRRPAGLTGQPAVGGGSGRRYGFNCGYCSSRLEATESVAAQEGQCPTCGSRIVIPILDRYGRLIDPRTNEIIRQDPHPVHAYAAAGDRAPRIERQPDGSQRIICPRCNGKSEVSLNNCKQCGLPFTMEGTSADAAGAANGFCVAALVLGIIGLPAFCTHIAPALAILFGIIGYNQVSRSSAGGRGMAIAGIVLGAIGAILALAMDLHLFK